MNRNYRLDLARDILIASAATGGILIIAVMAPNAIQLLSPLLKRYRKSTLKPSYVRQKINQLKKQGMMYVSEKDGKTTITLTKKGEEKILEYEVDEMEIQEQKPWDKKWRFVMFDIPEKRKGARDVFRYKLKQLGFEKIKNSVWAIKDPCSKEIEFLVQLYGIKPYVDLIEGKLADS